MSELIIVLAQINPLVGDIDGNTDLCIAEFQRARREYNADIVVFPELALMGYPAEDLLLRASVQPRIQRALDRFTAVVDDAYAVVGYPRLGERGLLNAAGVLHKGKLLMEYGKQELPNYRVFDEKRYFIAGQKPCVLLIRGVPVGITICEDIWQPGPAAQAAAAGARLLLNLSASPYHFGKQAEREQTLAARAKEVGLPIIYVNQVGGQDELVFDGGSVAVADSGEVLLRAPQFASAALRVRATWEDGRCRLDSVGGADEAQHAAGTDKGAASLPLAPRLEPVAEIYQALVCGLRDYVEKNRFKGVVLGLSGGIDSALTLAISVDALGPERVEAVMMPFRYTADISREDAGEQARRQGVHYRELSIESIFDSVQQRLAGEFEGLAVDKTEENIQARIRAVLLMAISNKKGYLVLTTGNKSELAVGYSTLYGDMAGGFSVLKDVFKTRVFELARYRNSIAEVIPERVIIRPPSAELSPGQLDQDSLPPYAELDEILRRYVECDESAATIIAAGFDRNVVEQVLRMVDFNEYKRRQAAIGVRITERGFGRDRRYPITSGWSLGD